MRVNMLGADSDINTTGTATDNSSAPGAPVTPKTEEEISYDRSVAARTRAGGLVKDLFDTVATAGKEAYIQTHLLAGKAGTSGTDEESWLDKNKPLVIAGAVVAGVVVIAMVTSKRRNPVKSAWHKFVKPPRRRRHVGFRANARRRRRS